MPLIVKETGTPRDFKPVPAGTHVGVCCMVVDVGLQPGFENGPPQRKVYVAWEIPAERTDWTDKDGNKKEGPMHIGTFLTLSLNEKAKLRAWLENWRGKPFSKHELEGFDLFSILNKSCLVGVTHKVSGDRTYANVTSIMGLPRGTQAPKVEGFITAYPDAADKNSFDKLPEWLQRKVEGAIIPDIPAPPAAATGTDDVEFADEVPF